MSARLISPLGRYRASFSSSPLASSDRRRRSTSASRTYAPTRCASACAAPGPRRTPSSVARTAEPRLHPLPAERGQLPHQATRRGDRVTQHTRRRRPLGILADEIHEAQSIAWCHRVDQRGRALARGCLPEQRSWLPHDHERAATEHGGRSRAGCRSRPAVGSGACRCRRSPTHPRRRPAMRARSRGASRRLRPRSGPGRGPLGRCSTRRRPRCRRGPSSGRSRVTQRGRGPPVAAHVARRHACQGAHLRLQQPCPLARGGQLGGPCRDASGSSGRTAASSVTTRRWARLSA